MHEARTLYTQPRRHHAIERRIRFPSGRVRKRTNSLVSRWKLDNWSPSDFSRIPVVFFHPSLPPYSRCRGINGIGWYREGIDRKGNARNGRRFESFQASRGLTAISHSSSLFPRFAPSSSSRQGSSTALQLPPITRALSPLSSMVARGGPSISRNPSPGRRIMAIVI